MTEDQAAKVQQAASGRAAAYVRVVKASNGRYGATLGSVNLTALSHFWWWLGVAA